MFNLQIMGVVNVTPDSFYDGGKYSSLERAVVHARHLLSEGADIIDIGGESTRPYAQAVTIAEQIARVVPVIKALSKITDKTLSIDTSEPEVMQAALAAGASLINDVRALTRPGALEVAARAKVPVCLMHMQQQPDKMQDNPQYNAVVSEVFAYLQQRIMACLQAGIQADKLIVDPGFGFGKNLQHNLDLLRNLGHFRALNCPILVGISRKSMIGEMLNLPVANRLHGSIAAAILAYQRGASIIRTHDVAATLQALQVAKGVDNI